MAKKPSEFGGDDPTPAGLQPKGQDAMTSGEKLRLTYRTGQDADPEAEVDPRPWRGELPL